MTCAAWRGGWWVDARPAGCPAATFPRPRSRRTGSAARREGSASARRLLPRHPVQQRDEGGVRQQGEEVGGAPFEERIVGGRPGGDRLVEVAEHAGAEGDED